MSYVRYLNERGYRPEIWDWSVGEQHFDSWSPTYVKPKRVWSDLSSSDKPILIFAPRGVGKSALRMMMQNHLETEKNYFVIEHVTMDPILRHGVGASSEHRPIPVSVHLEAIAEQATLRLVAQVVGRDGLPNPSPKTRRALCELWELYRKPHIAADWSDKQRKRWKEFAGPRWKNPLRTLVGGLTWVGKRLRLSSTETDAGAVLKALGELLTKNHDENAKRLLERLRRIVGEFGFEKIVVAVNGLDEHPDTHDLRKVHQINRILEPLLSSQQLLEVDGYVWRIFVPWHAKGSEAVRTFRGSSIDPRNLRRDLEWTADEMLCILGSRLLAFRTDVDRESLAPVEDPAVACDEVERLLGPDIARSSLMRSIIAMAHCNPRRLFSLMRVLTAAVAEAVDVRERPISGVIDSWTDSIFDDLADGEKRILIRYREAGKQTMSACELEVGDPDDAPDLQALVVKNQLQRTVGKTKELDSYCIADPALERWLVRTAQKSV